MLKNYFLIFLFSYFFIGCATHLNITNTSIVDPDYTLYTNVNILISTYEDDIQSKYYKSFFAKELRLRGFKNVYTKPSKNLNIDNIVYISLTDKTSTYKYTSADYGMINDGTSSTNCYGDTYSLNCSTTSGKSFGVEGYSTKTGYTHLHFLSIDWYDVASNKKILSSFSHTDEKGCKSDKLYKFIIKETIERMEFYKPDNYDYSIEMPKKYSCK